MKPGMTRGVAQSECPHYFLGMLQELFPSRESGPFGRRLKREHGTRIPVTLVTGFLGAGKTTLVRRFIETPEGAGTAVIVNEFGKVGIDNVLMRASTEKTTLLGNGCICCNTRTDLQMALRNLLFDRERGNIPHFVRVLIETSGLADPGPILQTFATDRALGGEFHLEVALAVVDAAAGFDTLEWSSEARKQVILADRLVLSKTDIAEPKQVAQLKVRLRELNAHADIDEAVNGALDPRHLIGSGLNPEMRQARSGFVAEAEHSDGIGSFVIEDTEPMAWEPFARGMETLISMRGPDLLRVKGLLDVKGCRGPVVVQFVQHLAHPPSELAAWPDDDRTSRIVFITRNVPEQHVRDLFAATRALALEGGESEQIPDVPESKSDPFRC